MKNYNTNYIRHFRCRMRKCKGSLGFNLQQVSQEERIELTCPQCGKRWGVTINKAKRACCGKVVLTFTSIEKNPTIPPIVYNQTVRK